MLLYASSLNYAVQVNAEEFVNITLFKKNSVLRLG